ncbi:MAG: hypothetical protein ACRDRU_28035 [Pseudonocardiaceae bacterium]
MSLPTLRQDHHGAGHHLPLTHTPPELTPEPAPAVDHTPDVS